MGSFVTEIRKLAGIGNSNEESAEIVPDRVSCGEENGFGGEQGAKKGSGRAALTGADSFKFPAHQRAP